MPNANPIIQAFNAGRLGPRLKGRVDLAKYAVGCDELENFLPTVQGPAVKRPGTRSVLEAKFADKETRLVPFEYSRTQAFILEFGHNYIRFFSNNGPILETADSFDATVTAVNPVVVTANSHGYLDGDVVFITGSEQRELNDRYFTVANKDTNTFQLSGEDGSGRTTGSSGTVARVYTLTASIPYTETDVAGLQFEQSNDVLYIASANHPPAKLGRVSNTSWTYTVIAGDQPPFNLENSDESITVGASAATGTSVTLTANATIFKSAMIGSYIRLRELYASEHAKWKAATSFVNLGLSTGVAGIGRVYYDGRVYSFANASWWAASSNPHLNTTGNEPPVHTSGTFDDGESYSRWSYVNDGYGYGKIVSVNGDTDPAAGLTHNVCVIDVNTDGMELPATVVTAGYTYEPTVSITATSTDNPCVVTAPGHDYANGEYVLISGTGKALLDGNAFVVVSANQSAGTFALTGADAGSIGTGSSGTAQRRNDGQVTSRWSISAWSAEYGYPRSLAFHQDRLFWGGTSSFPQTVWGSGTGDYENYQAIGEHAVGLDFTLSNQKQNAVEWIIGHEDALFVGTQGGEFTLGSQNRDEALSRDNFQVRRRSAYGCNAGTQALGVDAAIVFPQRAGRKIHELQYQFESDRYVAPDLTELCEDILIGGVKGMAMQHEPYRILWAWTDDGNLRSLTYVRDQEVAAWATHELGGSNAKVISAAVIPHPDGDEDQLWLLVERTVNNATVRSVEYLEKPWDAGDVPTSARYLDAAMSYAGEQGSIVSLSQGLFADSVISNVLSTTAAHSVRAGDFVRIATCPSSPTLVGTVFKVTLAFASSMFLADEEGNAITVPWAADGTDGTWEVVSKTITKADHLEGETVGVLADGGPVPSVVVSSGTATLAAWASKVELGLSYAAKLKTLPIEAGTSRGTAQGKTKRINRLVIRADQTGPGLEYGVDFTTMDQVQFMEVVDALDTPLDFLTGDTPRLGLPSGYDRTGQIAIRHQEPVPATIVALMPVLRTEEGG